MVQFQLTWVSVSLVVDMTLPPTLSSSMSPPVSQEVPFLQAQLQGFHAPVLEKSHAQF